MAFQRRWLETGFCDWIEGPDCRARQVVWIAGNHDFALELGGPGPRLGAAATYPQDSAITVGGLRIYGTPFRFHAEVPHLVRSSIGESPDKYEGLPRPMLTRIAPRFAGFSESGIGEAR